MLIAKCLVLVTVLALLMTTIESAAAQDRTYQKPRYADTRLDWCFYMGNRLRQTSGARFL